MLELAVQYETEVREARGIEGEDECGRRLRDWQQWHDSASCLPMDVDVLEVKIRARVRRRGVAGSAQLSHFECALEILWMSRWRLTANQRQ